MLAAYHLLLAAVILASLFSSSYHSLRYRRQQDPALRGLYTARMNVSMGVLLFAIASMQVTLFEMSSVRLLLAVVFVLLGLFNLFAGLRSHAYYTRLIGSSDVTSRTNKPQA